MPNFSLVPCSPLFCCIAMPPLSLAGCSISADRWSHPRTHKPTAGELPNHYPTKTIKPTLPQYSHFNPTTTNTTTSITSRNTTTTTFPAPPQLTTTHQKSWWVKQLWEKNSGLRIAESGGVPLLLYSLILSFRIYRRGCRHKILISTQL